MMHFVLKNCFSINLIYPNYYHIPGQWSNFPTVYLLPSYTIESFQNDNYHIPGHCIYFECWKRLVLAGFPDRRCLV